MRAKIGDFGLAVAEEGVEEEDDDFFVNPFPGSGSRKTRGIGTAMYAAPEQLHSSSYDLAADVFSAGVVFFELYQVFGSGMERATALRAFRQAGRCPESLGRAWPQLALLVEQMVLKRPALRPPAAEVLARLRAQRTADERQALREQVELLQRRNEQLEARLRRYESTFGKLSDSESSMERV